MAWGVTLPGRSMRYCSRPSSKPCQSMREARSSDLDAPRTLDIAVEFWRGRGDRSRELIRIATSTCADMVVIGRSRKTFLRSVRSVTRRLARAPGAPIVVIVP